MNAYHRTFGLKMVGMVVTPVVVSISLGAGGGSMQPEVGEGVGYNDLGVGVLRAKEFPSAEKQFRKAQKERRVSPRPATTWPTCCESRVRNAMKRCAVTTEPLT